MNTKNENAPKLAYRVTLPVRPMIEHPMYWDVGFGYLNIWLFAKTVNEAGEKACDVAECLPFERVGTKVEILEETLPLQPENERHEEALKAVGISLLFVGVRTGADEDGFETTFGEKNDEEKH